MFGRRKLLTERGLLAVTAGEQVAPASNLAVESKQVRELQRLPRKKTMQLEMLHEAVEYGRA